MLQIYLESVYLKASRAHEHLKALEEAVSAWVKSKPYTILEKDDPQRIWHAFVIEGVGAPADIPLLAGDFINCLRSSLDHLAWNLVQTDPATIPKTEGQARSVVFPICATDAAYIHKRTLFPPAVAGAIDSFQPEDRTDAHLREHLWRLERLWNIDKHRTIPVNCTNYNITLLGGMSGKIEQLHDRAIVLVPCLSRVCIRPVYVQPFIEPQILFGEYMGPFEVTLSQFREMYQFVTSNVIPAFACFFS